MAIGWVYHPFFLKHDTGPMHNERADRLVAVRDALDNEGLLSQLHPLTFYPADRKVLEYVHEPAFVKLIELACEQGMTFIGSRETRICTESFDVALLAIGGIFAACDALMRHKINGAFCAVRPPGHHAGPSQAEGFCLFNNIALAAEHLIRQHAVKRVAIVDWDVHHGNGTQDIFYRRNDVLYVSLHESPEYLYPHRGYAIERGEAEGNGYTLNIPMSPGSNDDDYRKAFDEQVVPTLCAYQPEVILISAGFDGAASDRTADIQLSPQIFHWMTGRVMDACNELSIPNPISLLEGGYDLDTLSRCACQHVTALLEHTSQPPRP